MNRGRIAGGLVVVALWANPYSALAQHEHGQGAKDGPRHDREQMERKLPLCPVMGDPVDFSVKSMTGDGPVYFCCQNCVEKFSKSPDKYAEKLAAQRDALKKMERIQVICPVSGNPVDGKTFAMIGGRGVSFCCKNCVPKYEKDPASYSAKLEASYTYQTKCPVGGEKIDPTAFTDLPTGQRVYFCCPACDRKFLKDPAEYAPKLAAQGINVDIDKLKAGKGGHGGHEEHQHDDGGGGQP